MHLVLALCTALLAASPPPTADQLTGTWVGDGFVLKLELSGKGSIVDGPGSPAEPLRWKVKGNTLALTQDGETVTYSLALKEEVLTVSGGDLDETVRLKRQGGKETATAGSKKGSGGPGTKVPPRSAKGTCEGACKHYLRCAQLSGREALAECLVECRDGGLDSYSLALFTATDCPTALALVAASEQQGWEEVGTGVAPQGKSNNSQCNGCVRDGSNCVWLSQGNWGAGPYSGAAADCDPSCCGL